MAFVYILKSESLEKFYVGSCINLLERLEEHQSKKYLGSFTTAASDWQLVFKMDNLDYSQARNIEAHIKKMKSKVYIENLIKFPEMTQKLIVRFSEKHQ
ncbi:MAG: GIY-YIG nuclease family protein [Flavobacteriales bacterium]|nr:GIY-YIG nuclease family protein [Flavobacteriales bacterium]